MKGAPLAPVQRRILGAWTILVTAPSLLGLAQTTEYRGEWQSELAALLIGLILAGSLIILVVVWLVIRLVAKKGTSRTIVAIFGPPAAAGLVALTIKLFPDVFL